MPQHIPQNPSSWRDVAAPVPGSNALGTAGFVVALLGLFTGGVLSPIGMILSLFALGREPRGLAIAGAILGFIGSCGGIIVFLLFGGAILALLGLGAASLPVVALGVVLVVIAVTGILLLVG
ncbi:MAG TPA: hypothetical protein PKC43_02005 [Phycisphaerales bacterium]|nr:hypothetical protein [Phycisphaerales bacterium]HMP36199.1 hypothetical protein [Phycisphaerales bacterium]